MSDLVQRLRWGVRDVCKFTVPKAKKRWISVVGVRSWNDGDLKFTITTD